MAIWRILYGAKAQYKTLRPFVGFSLVCPQLQKCMPQMPRAMNLRLFLVGSSIACSAAFSSPVQLLPKHALHRSRSPDRTFLGMRRGYADGPFGQVHYRDTGGEGTPIVLLPQAPGSSRIFERVLPEFKRVGVRAIAVDPPGVGMSDAAPFFLTIEEQVPSIVAVLDHLAVKQCDVFGIKTGAKLAAAVGAERGERVRKAVLVNALLGSPPALALAQASLQQGTLGEEFEYVRKMDEDGEHLKTWYGLWRADIPDTKLATRFVSDVFCSEASEADMRWPLMAAKCFDLRAAMLRMQQPALIVQIPASDFYNLTLETPNVRPDWECVELGASEAGSACLDDASELVAVVHTFLQK